MDGSRDKRRVATNEAEILTDTAPHIEDLGISDLPPPEWHGDIRDPDAGCWYVINQHHNSPTADPDHCRKPCVVGTRYCDQHQQPAAKTQGE